VIHTPHSSIENMPIQPSGATGIKGFIELDEAYVPALKDLDGFSHLLLLYVFHQVKESQLLVKPFLDGETHGLFATRAPKRPNPIGLSVVRLLSVNGNRLELENVDMLDSSPLLDIKPYVPDFDGEIRQLRLGWLQDKTNAAIAKKSDNRFS
jgi:tRNA-Thr(GGU) m(6)t(6)A37 methyltransferase TsaA